MNVNITHSFGTKTCVDILSKDEKFRCSTMKEEKGKAGFIDPSHGPWG